MGHKKHHESNLEKYEETHSTEAMVLSCIDYRFIDGVISFLESNPSLSMKYDFTTIAGSSLGYNQKKYKYWSKTFIDMVSLAIDLHHIKQLIVFDHMDCGAYQLFYPDLGSDSGEERLLHIKNINEFIRKLRKIFPDLIYSGYLLHVNGSVEKI